jgi:hypothetical protein
VFSLIGIVFYLCEAIVKEKFIWRFYEIGPAIYFLNLAYIDYCSAVGVILLRVGWVLCIGDYFCGYFFY